MQRPTGTLNVLSAILAEATVCVKTVEYSATLVPYVILSLILEEKK